jgi:hypothetical protein
MITLGCQDVMTNVDCQNPGENLTNEVLYQVRDVIWKKKYSIPMEQAFLGKRMTINYLEVSMISTEIARYVIQTSTRSLTTFDKMSNA